MAVTMHDLLNLVVEENASDLHIEVGVPPTLRLHGGMQPIDSPPLTPEDTEALMRSITNEDHIQQIRSKGGVDFGFAFGESSRFRVSVFRQKGCFGMVLRRIPSAFMTLEQIGLPPIVKELLYKPRGLILVTGPTGSGKSTTLASMINLINEERDVHIITIEDPIEYFHAQKRVWSFNARWAWTFPPSPRPSAARSAKIQTSFSWAKCATWRPPKPP